MKKSVLLKRIKSKEAKIGVIGLGYVGLPLVIEFCNAGFQVTGFDIDENKIRQLIKGRSYIKHIASAKVKAISLQFEPTRNFTKLKDMDCIIVCVPTPITKNREPDLTWVVYAIDEIAKYLRKGQLIVLESTTYPGTTGVDMQAILNTTGLDVGKDYFLAYSPEREDPNNAEFKTSNITKVVSGVTPKCLEVVVTLYDLIIDKTVSASSTAVAEASKLLENIYRAVNIALVNELKVLFDRMDINIWEVIELAKTKPFGFHAFYPSPGLGGHCIPIDPFYLTWKAKEFDISTKFIELAGEINTNMPYYVVDKTIAALNDKNKSIKDAKILILGLAYKKDIDDVRESPSIKIWNLLLARKAKVAFNDPYIDTFIRNKKEYHSVDLTERNFKKYDCVLILTNHAFYNPDFIYRNSSIIVDTRNVMKDYAESHLKITQA